MFGLTFLFMRAFFIIPFHYFIGNVIPRVSIWSFVVDYLYKDVISFAFAAYVSCMTAPSRRIPISVLYFIFGILVIPKQLEIANDQYGFGSTAWKEPFLISAHIAGAILPLLIMIAMHYIDKNKKINEYTTIEQ